MKEIRYSALVLFLTLYGLTSCGLPPKGDETAAPDGRTFIQNRGSDTLVNVAQRWAEAYQQVSPSVTVAVSGGGSGTGIAALINGTVDIANASRTIDERELVQAKERGYAPVEFVVGYDALAVYVHRDNPLEEITIERLAGIYGEGGEIDYWTELGIEVPGCRDQEIIVVSRQNNSGTYEYFRSLVLGPRRDYRLGTHDLHGSKDVVDLVQHTPCAIGYSGLAYQTHEVKALCISEEEGAGCVVPSVQAAVDGSYALSRPLFMYTNGKPEGDVKEYLDWVLSEDGQCILAHQGYAPAYPVECEGPLLAGFPP
jgi:phosphate transport system substrate-binding protein